MLRPIAWDLGRVSVWGRGELEGDVTLKASDIMTRKVITVGPDALVRDIAGVLSGHRISAVPICDAAGLPLGIVSEGDLMRPFGSANMLKRDWWLSLLAEGHDLAPEFVDYIATDHRSARALMSKPLVTASETTEIADLADLMISHGIKRLPIMRGGQIVGIVSRSDIVRSLVRAATKVARIA
jgi:CBS domain-containing protein